MMHKSVLSNGVRVLTEAMPQVVSSTIGIWVENGSRYEEASQNGTSHFIEHLLFKGTKKRTAAEIAEQIDAVGGVLNAFTGKEYTCYYAKVLGEDLAMATELLADMFLESVFDPSEVDRERQVVLQEISQAEDTPDDFIHDLFNRQLSGGGIRWPCRFAARSRPSTRSTARRWSRSWPTRYRSARVFIAAAGADRSRSAHRAMRAAVRRRSPATARPKQLARRPNRPMVLNQEKKLEQAHICIGGPGISQIAPLRYAGLRAQHRARRRDVVAAVPGSAREARPRLQHLLVHLVLHRCGYFGDLCGHQSRMGR